MQTFLKMLKNLKLFFKSKAGKVLVATLVAGLIFVAPIVVVGSYEKNIYADINVIPIHKVGIVFGAGVKENGQPSDVLKDRLKTAAELYKAGKIEKILVSGDNRFENYNEPESMYEYLTGTLGIPEENVFQDFAGRRTFDTCIRAKEIFGVEEAILITQEYHLKRAIFTCEGVGIKSVGFSATRQPYVLDKYFKLRELAATYKAFFDVYIWQPDYIAGKIETLSE